VPTTRSNCNEIRLKNNNFYLPLIRGERGTGRGDVRYIRECGIRYITIYGRTDLRVTVAVPEDESPWKRGVERRTIDDSTVHGLATGNTVFIVIVHLENTIVKIRNDYYKQMRSLNLMRAYPWPFFSAVKFL